MKAGAIEGMHVSRLCEGTAMVRARAVDWASVISSGARDLAKTPDGEGPPLVCAAGRRTRSKGKRRDDPPRKNVQALRRSSLSIPPLTRGRFKVKNDNDFSHRCAPLCSTKSTSSRRNPDQLSATSSRNQQAPHRTPRSRWVCRARWRASAAAVPAA